MIRFAILGYGFVGAIHAATLKKIKNADLVAIVEKDKSKWKTVTTGNIDVEGMEPLDVPCYENIDEMLKQHEVEALSICLPTFLHREYTEIAMQAGLHVVCEKPMALTLPDCDAMIDAAERYDRQVFVAQCIRFWPEYEILKDMHDKRELGDPISFRFHRLSGMPAWAGAGSWFLDEAKSGGCLFDLHVHDVDFAQVLLGNPRRVFSQGIRLPQGANAAVLSQFDFGDNLICTIEGSWLYSSGFKMTFSAVYENGQLEYDSGAVPTLKLYRKDNPQPELVPVPDGDGYVNEYNYFIDCLENGESPARILPTSAQFSIQLALAEQASMRSKGVVEL